MHTVNTRVLYGNLRKCYTTIVHAEGVYVYDESGKRYLDAVGGVGVVNIGHGVEGVIQAIADQARHVAFTYGGAVDNQPRQQLAHKLQAWAPPGMGEIRAFFCSGGAEANEAALKIAYQYHWERGHASKQKVIGRWQSYHGNTIATLSMGGRTQWRRMHSPLLLNFPHIPPPYCYRCSWGHSYPGCGLECAHELRRVIRQEGAENICAFIAEPVIGTSLAAVTPPPEYYPIIRDICDENDVLFICDEVLTGIGRTGKAWGIDHWQVTPDIITTAKGISGGYAPLAAVLLGEHVWRALADGSQRLMHSYTYGGNPLSCAAGVAVLDFVERHALVDCARQNGELLLAALRREVEPLPCVGEVRGRGMLLGVDFTRDRSTRDTFPPAWDVTHRVEQKAFDSGLLLLGGVPGSVAGVAGDHLQISPPYVLEEEHIHFIARTLADSISAVMSDLPAG